MMILTLQRLQLKLYFNSKVYGVESPKFYVLGLVNLFTIVHFQFRLSPSVDTQQKSLSLAIADMLWKCGKKKTAVVAL